MIEGAKQAKGLTIIIDVFRAFTTACYIMGNGARRIIPVDNIDIAYRLKRKNPDFILIGERKERIQPGFNYGNSPTHIEYVNFTGKIVVQTTSAGTQGIYNAKNAEEIITGSFVNAQAIVNYIKIKNPLHVSLVCMGYECLEPTDEDTFCAEYIRNTLENIKTEFNKMVNIVRNGAGKRFFISQNQEFSPKNDFHLCMRLNKFNFILKTEAYSENLVCLKKIDINCNSEQ